MVGDYISREAAKEALYKTAKEYDEYDKCDRIAIIALNNVDEILDDIPAVDVVAVVRCRECKHYDCGGGDEKCVKYAEWDEYDACYYGFISRHGPEFYCADGERKDGGQADGTAKV